MGGECIKVGGKLTASRNIQVFNQANSMNCDIVYKGSQSGKNKWKTNGEVRYDPDLDLSEYENMVPIWKRKSEYWSTLPTTGTVQLQYGGTTFACSNDDIQVESTYFNYISPFRFLQFVLFVSFCCYTR